MVQTERHTVQTENRSARINLRSSMVTALSTVMTLATAILGLVALNLNDDNGSLEDKNASLRSERAELTTEVDGLSQDLEHSQAQVSSLEQEVSDLQVENSELRALVPPSVAPEDVPDTRATGSVTLADGGDSIDLNSTLPNFDPSDDPYRPDSLRYDGESIRGQYGMSALELVEDTARFETCAVATGYADASAFEPHRLEQGRTCLRLDSGRYAAVVVTRFDKISVDVEVTVWE
ncbi:hypothetical protein [Cellulosimicrobium cellulans]|uniref:hypothetical protein n=1 Tax=Cellulosimicrobium cellulans TaxID=1710 RepID=UPI0037FE38D3